jgi:hypothetical protein
MSLACFKIAREALALDGARWIKIYTNAFGERVGE